MGKISVGHYRRKIWPYPPIELSKLLYIDETIAGKQSKVTNTFAIEIFLSFDCAAKEEIARSDVLHFLMQMPGLTIKTFLVIKETCQAIVDWHNISTFTALTMRLWARFQSDTIEGRFGHIRQLS